MNNKDNLQESFKKAFENHNEPLLNHQWERLNLDLKNQKKKSIFSFWNISIALGLIFLGTLIGFYLKPNKIFPFGIRTNVFSAYSELKILLA